MLASIMNSNDDFKIFLTDEEIDKLEFQSIKGEIYRFSNLREKCLPLELILDKGESEEKSKERIYRYIDVNRYLVYLSPYYHRELQEMGLTENNGDPVKIDIINESIVKDDKNFKDIKDRYENRDKLLKIITHFI